MSEEDTPHPTAKLEDASDHQERADQLIHEAAEDAKTLVEDAIEFPAEVTVDHHKDPNVVHVEVTPEALRDSIAGDPDGLVVTEPLRIRFKDQEFGKRERINKLKDLISDIEAEHDEGAPRDEVITRARMFGMDQSNVEDEIEALRQKGDVYEPQTNHLRTVL